jgi:hypothetical protein
MVGILLNILSKVKGSGQDRVKPKEGKCSVYQPLEAKFAQTKEDHIMSSQGQGLNGDLCLSVNTRFIHSRRILPKEGHLV